MTYEEHVVRRDDERAHPELRTSSMERSVEVRLSGGEVARRVVVLLFGILQTLIAVRILLLVFDAREGNALVSFILQTSQLFVAPFEGIFRTDALASGGSILDIAAIAALVGWTILEALVLWAIAVVRREP
jgi:hypothetical protein